jgi:hypothetical protein
LSIRSNQFITRAARRDVNLESARCSLSAASPTTIRGHATDFPQLLDQRTIGAGRAEPSLLRCQGGPAEDCSRPLANPGRPLTSVASHPQVAFAGPQESPAFRSGRPRFVATLASLAGLTKGPGCPSLTWNGASYPGRGKGLTALAQPSGGLGHLNIEVGHSVSMGYRNLTCPLVLV